MLDQRVTLLEVCEPLFQYMCRLNRSARKGVGLEPSVVRADVQGLISDMRGRAAQEPGMSGEFAKIELALIYYVDYMIKESDLSFARDWEPLAYAQNRMAGDEEFFDLLDETLADPSDEAAERLAVFYTCIGLGFQGINVGQPEHLRAKMREIGARLRHRIESDEQARICPDAYEHVDTSDLVQPPGRSIAMAMVIMLVAGVGVVLGNGILYSMASEKLQQSVDSIINAGQAAEAALAERDG